MNIDKYYILMTEGVTAYDHQINCKLHLFPINGCGAVEKLLLDCAAITYEPLSQEARGYRDRIMTSDYEKIRHDCWATNAEIQEFYADKVQFGALSSVLKPDRPVRFAIKDKLIRKAYFELYMTLPEFEALHNFLSGNLV